MAGKVKRKRSAPKVKSVQTYIDATVTLQELTQQRYSRKPGESYAARLFQWVYICASKNAEMCASTPIRLYRNKKGGRVSKIRAKTLRRIKAEYGTGEDVVEVDRSIGLDMLARPNQFEDGFSFCYRRFMAKESMGNSWIYSTDDQLLTLLPAFVSAIAEDNGEILWGWNYGRERVKEIQIPREEVFHCPHLPSLDNPFYGVGPLWGCMSDADLMTSATTAEAARWRNEGRPPLAIQLPETMSQTAREQAIKDFERQVRGIKNSGKPLIMQFADIKNLGFAPKEMEYLAGQQVSERRIWAAFGIPESIIRPNEGALAAAKTGLQFYTEQTIWPRLDRDARQLTEHFRRMGWIAETEFFCYDSPTSEDEKAEAELAKIRSDSGHMTLDEVRAMEGLDPLPNGLGAIPRFAGMPLSLTSAADLSMLSLAAAKPAEVDGAEVEEPEEPEDTTETPSTTDTTKPAGEVDSLAKDTSLNGAQVTALSGLATQVAAGTLPMETAVSIARAAFPAIDEATLRGIFGPLKGFELPKEEVAAPAAEAQPREKVFVTITACGENVEHDHPHKVRTKAKESIDAIESAFRAEVQAWMTTVGSNVAEGVVVVDAAQRASLLQIVNTHTADAWMAAGQAQAVDAGATFNMAQSDAIAAVSRHNSLIIEQISGTTEDQIRNAVTAGLEQGKTMQEVSADIVSSGYPENRAMLIAKTETVNAEGQGAYDFAKSINLEFKNWLLGGNPCEVCEGIYAKVKGLGGKIPIDQPFALPGEFPGVTEVIDRIPAHPGCNCENLYGDNL